MSPFRPETHIAVIKINGKGIYSITYYSISTENLAQTEQD
jgi:hypothetical protein